MRETRTSGSEGGGADKRLFLPLSKNSFAQASVNLVHVQKFIQVKDRVAQVAQC